MNRRLRQVILAISNNPFCVVPGTAPETTVTIIQPHREGGYMKIQKATETDLDKIMKVYAHARAFMAASGNPNQWGPTNWPPIDLVRQDIATGRSYVCVMDSRIVGVFFYDYGKDIEPTYRSIEDGTWSDASPYGVVHRIASDGTARGVGRFCLDWAFAQCGHLKIDTHPDNLVMQGLLAKLGFERRGIIHVEEDDYPRFAYEKTRKWQKGFVKKD